MMINSNVFKLDEETFADAAFEIFEISEILTVKKNETLLIKDKNVFIKSIINCSGDLGFENCIIHFKDPNSISELVLTDGSTLRIENCQIVSHKEVENTYDYFIRAESNSNVSIRNCLFNSCLNFLKANSDSENIHLEIVNCKFVTDYNANYELALFDLLETVSAYLVIDNCVFVGHNYLINGGEVTIEGCFFENCQHIIWFGQCEKISHCEFKNCREIISESSGKIISNCKFYDFTDTQIFGDISTIELCTFESPNRIKYFIIVYDDSSRYKTMIIDSCIFRDLNSNGLIVLKLENKYKGKPMLTIKNCHFINCSTPSKQVPLVSRYSEYEGLFKKKKVQTVNINNCMGLDIYNCF